MEAVREVLLFSGLLVCAAALGACSKKEADMKATVDASGRRIPDGGKRVFVTSTSYAGSFAVALASAKAPVGAAAGDALCQLAAEAAHLGGKFSAYLFDQRTLSNDRVTAAGPWYGMDGTMIFSNKANLVTSPQAPIEFDENGRRIASGLAWVGDAQDNCEDWTTSNAKRTAMAGDVGVSSQRWRHGTSSTCFQENHIYCFEN